MLIKFEIQMDDNGGVGVQAQANANPNAAAQKQTPAAYVAPNPATQKAGDPPVSGFGTGIPTTAVPSGAGMVFVLGPIVVCGSGPGGGTAGLGGDPPVSGFGTGEPKVTGEPNKKPNGVKSAAEKPPAGRRPAGNR